MAISWDSIRAFVLFFGPMLLPKAISYYRSVRSAPRRHGLSVQPVPTTIRIAIFMLSFFAFMLVVKTLPFFSPENVFTKTQSRLQIPVDVLFNRISAVRPNNVFTEWDHALRSKFVNQESRLLYFQFGPEVLAECLFCSADEPRSYFYYALPAILWPHIANLTALAIVTSPSVTGKYGSQWRSLATIASAILAGLEVYFVHSYNHQVNSRALRLSDIDFFYWTMRNYRFVALAALDAVVAFALYLAATNRAFVQPPSPAERIELVNRALVTAKSKMNASGIVKNTIMRDEDLRSRSQGYWQHEVRLMGEVMEEREVIDGVNDALSNRIDIQNITRDAETYTQSVLRQQE
ncbi:uncharacterized protein TrAFT101_011067 [Trichoderma asperellum]|uniref:Chorismate synthase protein n=1 Tax=Trichoderma asperellum (strain ATCC 204424 / CBS 433.97 / NBRC 101777) TaxID=1042311 RepID=A0A2T3YXQ5_TRIA4|nr:hypothetical protein M441DRAFT_83223 [Trichoderma asperellum CBS 433.97]PTB37339.1 hypothetical protein M441DRAFT_83223 [Trichoderma asperellum CBS 433.97]UKZ96267.1 hypothetical protein TrAFT101_011067 [Trichoderma asperellum]